MVLLRVDALPDSALDAASAFHSDWLGRAREGLANTDLLIVFQPADHTHRAWRLAAVQGLAREFAPRRVNAVVSDDPAAIASAQAYLATAPGLTGQLLLLDSAGAGAVIACAT